MRSRGFLVAGLLLLGAAIWTSHLLAQTTASFGQGAVRPGDGIKPPSLIKQVQPRYTDDARQRKVEGDIELEAVIDRDGTVREVRVTKSFDPSLEKSAVEAARRWVFRPGTDRDGHPVPVIVTMILSFRLHSQDDDGFLRGVCTDAPDLVHPTLVSAVEAKYTPEALRAKIQGNVVVEVVVDPDGSVVRARVVESLDKVYGLDDQAVAAAKQFKFAPNSGTCHGGLPTWTLARLTLSFRIH